MRTNIYSLGILYLALLSSLNSLIYFLNSSSLLWIYIGFIIFISLNTLNYGSNYIGRRVSSLGINDDIINVFSFILSLSFTLTSIHGLFIFLDWLPIRDKSIFLIPYLSLVFLYSGSIIGLYQNKRHF